MEVFGPPKNFGVVPPMTAHSKLVATLLYHTAGWCHPTHPQFLIRYVNYH